MICLFPTTSIQLIPYYREGKIRNGTNRSAYECELYGTSEPIAQMSVEWLDQVNCPNGYVQFNERSIMNEKQASWQ